jgi:hypothetical protein
MPNSCSVGHNNFSKYFVSEKNFFSMPLKLKGFLWPWPWRIGLSTQMQYLDYTWQSNTFESRWVHLLKHLMLVTVFCLQTKENKLSFSVFCLQRANGSLLLVTFSVYKYIYIYMYCNILKRQHIYINRYRYINLYIYSGGQSYSYKVTPLRN